MKLFDKESLKSEKKISGYRIYNAKQKLKTKHNNLPDLYPELPTKKYSIIYADPPWDYGGKMQFDKSGKLDYNKDWKKDVFISAANFKYPTVKTKDLKKIPIYQICEDDCLLFMWVTNPHLQQGIELGTSWGFDYKTVGFVWDKMKHNPGQYTVSYCELCLIFKKGRIPKPRGKRNIKQLIRVPRGRHSEKPNEVIKGITQMFPSQNKIELFARRSYPGWESWGLEIEEILI